MPEIVAIITIAITILSLFYKIVKIIYAYKPEMAIPAMLVLYILLLVVTSYMPNDILISIAKYLLKA